MTLSLIGFGTALPEYAVAQADAADFTRSLCCTSDAQQRRLRTLFDGSGVGRRHSVVLDSDLGPISGRQSFYVPQSSTPRGPSTAQRSALYEKTSKPLAASACRRALVHADVLTDQITHLVTVSCSGFFAPGVDSWLIGELSLSPDVGRTHVGFMGCHGALNGLRVAHAFAGADPRSRILLCSVELCTLHFQYGWNVEKVVANALFADGAAAVVAVPCANDGSAHWRLRANGSHLIAGTEDAMSWRIGDHGFVMTLSREVPGLIRDNLKPWLNHWLADYHLSVEDVGTWAVHPGGPRILTATQDALGLDADALADSREVLRTHGNMSSPTILFILDRLRRSRAPGPCVALGFGPGLTVEAALLDT